MYGQRSCAVRFVFQKKISISAERQIPIYRTEPNKITPTDFENLLGLIICILRRNYIFLDRRGRRSLQVEIKLPYENQPFGSRFFVRTHPYASRTARDTL